MSAPTYFNRVSGDTLLLLEGTITGYLIPFIQKLFFGTTPEKPTPEEE